jgi:Tfp pilus assembly protein PilP
MTTRVRVLGVAVVLLIAAVAAAQAPVASPPPTPTPTPTPDQLIEPAGFTYSPEGRRDPFVSLIRRGGLAAGGGIGPRPAGLAGLAVAEVTLRGTMRGREGFVGVLQGADQRTYIVRAGDRLFDGTIRTISQNDMVIVQQVNDPLSLEKQREVRKMLRQVEAN